MSVLALIIEVSHSLLYILIKIISPRNEYKHQNTDTEIEKAYKALQIMMHLLYYVAGPLKNGSQ